MLTDSDIVEKTAGSIQPTAANQVVHARILVRLGDSGQALKTLDASLARDSKNPQLLAAKGFILYDNKDYAGSAAAARAALQVDPKNQEALWIKHASEDRNAPTLKLPGSPWGAGAKSTSVGVGNLAEDSGKPYTLAVKVGASPPPPSLSPDPAPGQPSRKTDPLAPLAATGVILWIAAGVAAKQAQNKVVDGAERAGEVLADRASTVVQNAKMFAENHPYGTTAAVGGTVILGLVLGGPLIGGPTLMAAGAAGESVPVAGAIGTAAVSPTAIAAAGAGTLALSVGGDVSPNRATEANKRTNRDSQSSANAQDSLKRKLDAVESAEKNAASKKTLPDGRIRYYDAERPARTPGATRGASFVTEYDPKTGDVKQWMESYDHQGKVVRIHLKMINGQLVEGPHIPPTGSELAP